MVLTRVTNSASAEMSIPIACCRALRIQRRGDAIHMVSRLYFGLCTLHYVLVLFYKPVLAASAACAATCSDERSNSDGRACLMDEDIF
jgi:hypothetical protein